MFKRIVTGALVFGLAALAPPAAMAQVNCANREAVIERLQNSFKESLSAAGLQSANSLIEVWSSNDTGSWTIISTQPSGISCVLASGSYWHQIWTDPSAMGSAAKSPSP